MGSVCPAYGYFKSRIWEGLILWLGINRPANRDSENPNYLGNMDSSDTKDSKYPK